MQFAGGGRPRVPPGWIWIAATLVLFAVCGCGSDVERKLAQGFAAYDAATDLACRRVACETILNSGAATERIAERLRQGRSYAATDPTGWTTHQMVGVDGVERPFHVYIPPSYDPTRPCTVLFELHGGSLQAPVPAEEYLIGRAIWQPSADQLGWALVYPMADAGATWFDATGQQTLLDQLAFLKQRINVDENRVFLSGYSSGGAGAIWQAAHAPTPWAGFLSYNGTFDFDRIDAGTFLPRNLLNRPLRATNGLADGIIPAASVAPFVEQLQSLGVDLAWQTYPVAHNVSFFPYERAHTEAFIAEHARAPFRADIAWESDSVETGRCDWVRIDEIADVGNNAVFDEFAVFRTLETPAFGAALAYQGSEGFVVVGVEIDSIAQLIGVKPGDHIVRIEARAVTTAVDIDAAIAAMAAGSAIEVEVERTGETVLLSGTLPQGETAYVRPTLTGTILVHAEGNEVQAHVTRVARFTLFVSSEQFDFAAPVRIFVNGSLVHEGVVRPDARFMLERAAEDLDRKAVYEAKIEVSVPRLSD